ncbi:MAG TPA: HPr family phosphocarrier protein [Anaerolineae bacterium]|nr:HPr family phosphocarrier protein [Anaerolineae bacterium]HOQ99864.1 HPr family phosphocarrier protein [Anaerolineae bacterium]HPL30143.1 HPr family phosphocarrier protein [Anaerolineae bacterium]
MKEIELVVGNRTGLHARPAREFVNIARQFQSDIRVSHGVKSANAKSLLSILTLGVERGGTIRIQASGEDEEAALQALQAAVLGGLGEGAPGQGDN